VTAETEDGTKRYDFIIVGAGFTGLTAGLILAKAGKKVCILEEDEEVGGLAQSFKFKDGVEVERFYHHWFTSDIWIDKLTKELNVQDQIQVLDSLTSLYFNGRPWKMSTPKDLLKFKELTLLNRFRLGFLLVQIRFVKDWRKIEHKSIREWLEPLCGAQVFKVIWEPLIDSKFGMYADEVSAVWMWKKLKLRGNSRNSKGVEQLRYYKSGFSGLANSIKSEIALNGGKILTKTSCLSPIFEGSEVVGLETSSGNILGDGFIFTQAPFLIAKVFKDSTYMNWIESLNSIKYLGNVCLVIRSSIKLSDTYWMNVNDPGFPFVGVIEHTNLDKNPKYGGTHIIYLSRYVAESDFTNGMSDDEYLHYSLEHLQRMFPEFDKDKILEFKVWRSQYAQPVTSKCYSQLLDKISSPYGNVSVCTMAQIYPEDRGTNYAIRSAYELTREILNNGPVK
jgi:protoporphyrinogen oxidase